MLKNKILLLSMQGFSRNEILNKLMKDPELLEISEEDADYNAEKINTDFVTIIDTEYPKKLRVQKNAPTILYYWGDIKLLNDKYDCVTGSKYPTTYGLSVTNDVLKHNKNNVVLSGVSFGIDKQVAMGSISLKKKFIGIVSSEINKIYPNNMYSLCKLVVEHGGVIISLFQPNTNLIPDNFYRSNELLAILANKISS